MKKDKQKVIGEELSDERIKELLTLEPPAGVDRALHILTRAYRALRAGDFERFLHFYSETGLEINPVTPEGRTFLSVLETHHHASPYIQALKNFGAS
ncbi:MULTISPECIES: PA4642 family protein [unclassified Endozoicomonas]|uniref:PA4642 family protein n=1 Tax=unclassified Endozoicomonas TaxID=2644528 RepID=UPI002148704A|nr:MULTISPECIES: PA4642 family protein [unclassified Endozoicomonas]